MLLALAQGWSICSRCPRKRLHSTSISLLLVMSGTGVPGRVIPSLIADRYCGPVKVSVASTLISAITLFCWMSVRTIRDLYIFVAFFGVLSSGINSLFPASLAALTPDMYLRGTRMGMGFVVAGLGCLTGSPLGGTLIKMNSQRYLYVQLWAAGSLLLASLCILLSCVL